MLSHAAKADKPMQRPMPAVLQGRTGTFTEHRLSDGLSDILRGGGARRPRCHVFARGSYWVPGWWEEVWVACLQGLYDSRRGRREPATGREDLRIWRHRIWSTSWH